MIKPLIALLFALAALSASAQESRTVYNFLRLPVSAHAAALGGDNISVTDDDASLVFANPALASSVSDRTLGLNFMSYMQGSKTGSASFVKAWGERATWGAMAQFMDYGTIHGRTADNIDTGDESARDIMLGGTLAYNLTDKLAGGVSLKLIQSSIAGYSSMAVGVDLGLNWFDADRDLSLSAAVRNLGGQVEAYDDNFERIPLDISLGATKRLKGSPLRLSATMARLNDWHGRFINHFSIGADAMITDLGYLAVGYNFRRADEMKIAEGDGESSHKAGLSLGAGLQLQRFRCQVAWGKYHVSTSSVVVNVSYSL